MKPETTRLIASLIVGMWFSWVLHLLDAPTWAAVGLGYLCTTSLRSRDMVQSWLRELRDINKEKG